MIESRLFSNGLKLLYNWTPQDPIAACHLFLPNGAVQERAGQEGLTTLHWSLFNKGTKKRDSRKIAEDTEMLGASMGAGATYDYSELSCHAPAEQIKEALQLLAECLFEPTFNEKEFQKEKTAILAAIRSKKESIFTVTHEELSKHLYPNHPYAHPASGTEQSVQNLQISDVIARHQQMINPAGAILSMASNIPLDKMLPHFDFLFGSPVWQAHKVAPKKLDPTPPPYKSADFKCTTEFEQAYLMMGYPAPAVGAPDYIAVKVMNAVLGGGMSTRLFQTLREREGLAYDVGSFYGTKLAGSSFVVHMGLQASRLSEAKHGIFRELQKMQDEPVPSSELQQVKNQLKGGFILDHQTNSQRAHYAGWWEILGLGAEFDQRYSEEIEKITPAEVHRVAKKYLSGPCITVETIKTSSPNVVIGDPVSL